MNPPFFYTPICSILSQTSRYFLAPIFALVHRFFKFHCLFIQSVNLFTEQKERVEKAQFEETGLIECTKGKADQKWKNFSVNVPYR